MKKGKVIVSLALCVCAVLIVIGIALGNNPIRSSVGQSQSVEMNPVAPGGHAGGIR